MMKLPVTLMNSVPQGQPVPKRRANPVATANRATAPSAPPRATSSRGVARASTGINVSASLEPLQIARALQIAQCGDQPAGVLAQLEQGERGLELVGWFARE